LALFLPDTLVLQSLFLHHGCTKVLVLNIHTRKL
jgi:hypothetical protein